MNATYVALAYVVMALGLNMVVGFAGLLDLGFTSRSIALGAYFMVGWFRVGLLLHTPAVGGGKGSTASSASRPTSCRASI